MGNDALSLNPQSGDFHLSVHGSDWLWAAFCVFALSLLVVVFLDLRRPRGTRLFHQIAIIVLTVATLAYFSMASGLGGAPVTVEFRDNGLTRPTREIWFARFIQWFFTFPLLLLELLLSTGLSLSDIFTTIFMAMVVVIAGLVGAFVVSTYKWGYFTFGMAALFYIWYVLLWHAPHTTFAEGGKLRTGYLLSASYFSFLLILYPIAWGCSEGGNVISVTSEMVWYGVLDILAGPVFIFLFLFNLRSVDYETFQLSSGKYTDTSATHPAPHPTEKTPPAGTAGNV
ncbi:hypothetical protein A0H81_04248 [Grifola frondosa]|uniref:Protein FDD123 n=1 Tax=Grifola frondosa TaxID=5627 RepID=A0A1C7MEJ7_GRIFR|nr:hypothetical protein A0H81_04248 [Grifola frondosa]